MKNITDGKGRVIDVETVYEGEPGKDLVLTMDSEVQLAMEEIVGKRLLEYKQNAGTKYLDRAFFVMLDPIYWRSSFISRKKTCQERKNR